jgi:hypothetical protein
MRSERGKASPPRQEEETPMDPTLREKGRRTLQRSSGLRTALPPRLSTRV